MAQLHENLKVNTTFSSFESFDEDTWKALSEFLPIKRTAINTGRDGNRSKRLKISHTNTKKNTDQNETFYIDLSQSDAGEDGEQDSSTKEKGINKNETQETDSGENAINKSESQEVEFTTKAVAQGDILEVRFDEQVTDKNEIQNTGPTVDICDKNETQKASLDEKTVNQYKTEEPNFSENDVYNEEIQEPSLSEQPDDESAIGCINKCIICGTDIGENNPRQYCYKTYCPWEC